MSDDEVLQQINKRLTLNLLIAGAGAHTFLTAHHVVRDELEALRPRLTRLYDKCAISFHLNYWIGDSVFMYGFPNRFWRRTHRPAHPFHKHALLARHGGELSRASKRYLIARGWKKWVISIPVIHTFQMIWLLIRVAFAERRHKPQLEQIAKKATARIWGIDENRLKARLTRDVAFGYLREPKTAVGKFTRAAAIGYGGVVRRRRQFQVVAKSVNIPLVLHELTKGTAELICLHGLNSLNDETYEAVTDEADQLEYEVWMLQAGAEMWRRLLAVLPTDRGLAEMLMHIARLDPEPLEQLMLDTIENPDRARDNLQELANAIPALTDDF